MVTTTRAYQKVDQKSTLSREETALYKLDIIDMTLTEAISYSKENRTSVQGVIHFPCDLESSKNQIWYTNCILHLQHQLKSMNCVCYDKITKLLARM
jgi:phenolic acid decarboxylase